MSVYSYKKLILNWLECFPKANFKLALFQKEDLICNDLISDFLVKIGLPQVFLLFRINLKIRV